MPILFLKVVKMSKNESMSVGGLISSGNMLKHPDCKHIFESEIEILLLISSLSPADYTEDASKSFKSLISWIVVSGEFFSP